jgi:RNA recognition motif-containing protein
VNGLLLYRGSPPPARAVFCQPQQEEILIEKIFVSNLPHDATEEQLKEHFQQHGAVRAAKIITNGKRHRSRCFGFVDMENAEKAIAELNGKEFGGRPLRVNKAWDRESLPSSRPHRDREGRGGGRRERRY